MNVSHTSGIHYLACAPEEMRASAIYDFYKNFPAVWDESKLLDAELGSYISMARRSGDVWYVGGITTGARTNAVALDFLGEGSYLAQLYMDGSTTEHITETKVVTKTSTLSIDTLENGGYVIKLTPLATATFPDGFHFGETSATLIAGDALRNSAVPSSTDASIIRPYYTSSNEAVATVSDQGVITAVGMGNAEIKATNPNDGTVYDTCTVAVVDTIDFTPTAEGTVVYLSATGNDSNDGTTPETAVATLAKAFELSTADGTKVIRVSGEISGRSVTTTAEVILEGVDSNAEIVLSSLTLGAPLTVRNITLNVSDFLNTNGMGFAVKENVRTAQRIMVHSGKQDGDGGKEIVTLESGSFRLYSGTYYNTASRTMAGALYTFGGTADVYMTLKTDGWNPSSHYYHGTTFTAPVTVVNNGAKVFVNIVSYDILPVALNDGFQVINNNGAVTSVSGVSNYVRTSGYYIAYADQGGALAPTDTKGTFTVTPDEGKTAIVINDGKVENAQITVANGYAADIQFVNSGVAMIGSVVYATLTEAVSAARSGDTIKLIADVTVPEGTVLPAGVALNVGSFTLTGSAVTLQKGASVLSETPLTTEIAAVSGSILAEGTRNGIFCYLCGADTAEGTVVLYGKTYTVTADDAKLTVAFTENGYDYRFETDGTAAVTLENGADVTVAGGTVSSITAQGTAGIHLNGGTAAAIYRTAANAVNITSSDSKVIFTGWDADNKALFTNLFMVGMQIRVTGSQGLRFIAELSGNSNLNEYGLVILPEDLIPAGEELTLETPSSASVRSTNAGFKLYSEENGVRRYTVCITNIAPKYYNRKFTVRAYVTYQVDGNPYTVYSDPESCDILTVAKGLNAQYPGQYEELYQQIMNDYSATFVSAGEFKSKLTGLALAESNFTKLNMDFNVSGVAINASGNEETKEGWSVSDYIEVGEYEIVQYCLSASAGVSSLAFYDAEKNFLEGISKGSGTDEYAVTIYQKTIPENAAYVRFSNCDSFDKVSAILCCDIGKALNEYSISKDTTNLSGKKIVCVGDSLTYGDYGTTVPGKGYPHGENYPYYLAQYTGATVEWYACGGYTAKNLAQDYDGTTGVFSGIGRPGVSVSVSDADYVIVMLGTNGGLPLIGDRSNYDAYVSLVQQLKEDTKAGAQIVLMTPPHATEDSSKVNYGYMPNVQSAYSGVYKIADACGVTVFDVYRDSGMGAENEDFLQPNDGLHFGGVGYSALAAFVANELRLLKSGKLDALSLSESEEKADSEFLAEIAYPKYELAEGTYSTMGRWFKKTINGVEHDVTLTSGSELYFLTSGAESFAIDFTSMTDADELYFAVSVDGEEPVRYPASQNVVALPDKTRHAVRVTMDGIYENIGKWNDEVGYAVKEITVNGGRIRGIRPTNDVIFYYGDSITEGIMSQGNNGIGKYNSAVSTYAYKSAEALGSIPYFIGYGASGIVSNGSFANMLSAIDNLSASRKEADSVKPAEIVINHGYNDYGTDSETFKSQLRSTLTRLKEKYPETPVYYVIPFSQRMAEEIRAVCSEPEFENVSVIETAGFSITYANDGIHPNASGHSVAAEIVANYIKAARLATRKYDSYITYRKSLQNTNHKLLTDKSLNIAYYGGSVTQGYGASDGNNIWRRQTQEWFQQQYPEAQINEIYACIGESGTYLGTYLLDDYVLAKNPDLVFLEYAINDRYAHITKEDSKLQCETIIRTIKEQFPKCDIVMLITIDSSTSGENWNFEQAQAHAEIADAYHVPIIYMGRALADYIDAHSDTCQWSDYFIDIVHPTDAGYLFYTDVIEEYLNNELVAKTLPNEYLPEDVLPELQSAHLMDGNRKLMYATGDVLGECDTNVWHYYPNDNINRALSDKGSIGADLVKNPVFTYTFTGTDIALYNNICSWTTESANAYKFKLTVDGVESWVAFGTHNPTVVIKGLESGEHTVSLQVYNSMLSSVCSRWYIDLILTRDAAQQTVKG